MTDETSPSEPPRPDEAILAIVGSRWFVNPNAFTLALQQIWIAFSIVRPAWVVSGGADGIDGFGVACAVANMIPHAEIRPTKQAWAGPGGFEERNRLIVDRCTHLLSIRCAKSTTYGSGWTADHAESLGRQVVRITVPARGMLPIQDGGWRR